MARDRFDYAHGDVGTEPPTALDFVSGAKPEPEYHDWFWTEVTSKINLLFDELDRLDSDDDGVVDEADYANDADASTYKGQDLDSDGDGQVDAADQADNATTLQSLTPADIRTAIEDSGSVVVGDTTAISFDGDLQVTDDGDGTVTVSFTRTNDTRTDVSDDGARVVAEVDDINFGSNVDVVDDGDGTVTVSSDNTTTVKNNDIDTDGDGKVDAAEQADDASTLQGNTPSDVRVAVEDDQTQLDGAVEAISFEGDLNVSSDGDGTVTVGASNVADTHTNVSDDGNRVVNSVDDINFGSNVEVIDNGDGTVTVTSDDTTTVKGNDIDSNADGKVDAAEQADNATTVKGNDIDSNGDGRVDEADFAANADTVDGSDASDLSEKLVPGYAKVTENGSVTRNVDGIVTNLDIELFTNQSEENGTVSVKFYYTDGTTETVSRSVSSNSFTNADDKNGASRGIADMPAKQVDKFDLTATSDGGIDKCRGSVTYISHI
jgi:hypothetical protein